MLISFKRVIRIGLKNFGRNPTLSLATVLVMAVVISLITLLFFSNVSSKILVNNIQDKIDISVYFDEEAARENVLELKAKVAAIPEVKNVEYVSKEQAMEAFSLRHKDDPTLMASLEEVGSNPFTDSLSIRTWQASQYEQVAKFLNDVSSQNLIKKIDYFERKSMIARADSIINGIKGTVLGLSIILGIIAVFVAFNTIKIAILNSHEEISVMRLVGASNWFIRGPFLIEGILIGVASFFIVLLITFALCYGFNEKIKDFAPIISTFNIFMTNFWLMAAIQLASGVLLGVFSSFIAVRKYLRV